MHIVIFALAMFVFIPVFAQDDINPSLTIVPIQIPGEEFNVVARDARIVQLDDVHTTSWQVTIDNNLLYSNPQGNAVIRLYDDTRPDTFIEVGMGSPPEYAFWAAVQLPEVGYVPIYNDLQRGWSPSSKTIVSYTDRAGLTINNGARIVVTNLDIDLFAIDSYSVYGKQGSTDPPAINSGMYSVEFLSGDPSQNIFNLYPFVLAAVVGTLVGVLFLTKKRS